IQHPLPGRQQLPVQQVAQAAGAPAAQVRCGQAAAHASSRSACTAPARTRSPPSGSPAALIATAVCEALCGPAPIITAPTDPPPLSPRPTRGGPPQFQDLRGVPPFLEPRHGEAPASRHVVRKPAQQAVREPAPPGPLNATTRLTAIPARPHHLPP